MGKIKDWEYEWKLRTIGFILASLIFIVGGLFSLLVQDSVLGALCFLVLAVSSALYASYTNTRYFAERIKNITLMAIMRQLEAGEVDDGLGKMIEGS